MLFWLTPRAAQGRSLARSCICPGCIGGAACTRKAARQAAARSRVLFIGYFGVVPFIRFIVMTCWRTVSCLRSRLRSADGALVWHGDAPLSWMDLTLEEGVTKVFVTCSKRR